MRTSDRGQKTRAAGSKLSESLVRLQRTVQSTQLRNSDAQSQFDEWLTRWESSREQIVQRLTLIDNHLQELVQQRDCGPHLSVHRADAALGRGA